MDFNNLLIIIFVFLLFLSIHSYLLYPVVIKLISIVKYPEEYHRDYMPSITILLSAYNEDKIIEERIENISKQDYDFSKIEVIVGSDCSSDMTNEILLRLEKEFEWLKVFIFSERKGKAGVLNDIAQYAKNEILIFTDANTEFNSGAIKKLVNNFGDEKVGGVSGRLILSENILGKKSSVEEKKYWQYETFIKKSEGKLGILIGANGGIFAIRKSLFTEIPLKKAVTDDLFLSLSVLQKKYKFVYEPRAVAYEEVGKSVAVEFKRKVRFAATNFQTLLYTKSILHSGKFLLAYAFFSHKITRWFFPFIMITLFILNLFLVTNGEFFYYCILAQVIFYLLALLGLVFSFFKIRILIFSLPFFFVIANIALIAGFIKFLRKKHSVIWQSTER